jgi:hypothetical protein
MSKSSLYRLLVASRRLILVVLVLTVLFAITAATRVIESYDDEMIGGLTYLGTTAILKGGPQEYDPERHYEITDELFDRYRYYALSDQKEIPYGSVLIAPASHWLKPGQFQPNMSTPAPLTRLDDVTLLSTSATLISFGALIGATVFFVVIRFMERRSPETTFP